MGPASHFQLSLSPHPRVQALAGFSMTLEAGKVTAFVGGSGSGKSTVAKLVQRLYDPDAGEVTLDGRSLCDLDSAWFRSLLGVVSQEAKLFPADVAANISYGRPDATQASDRSTAVLCSYLVGTPFSHNADGLITACIISCIQTSFKRVPICCDGPFPRESSCDPFQLALTGIGWTTDPTHAGGGGGGGSTG
jgi:ABC-type multidrug transport system fused ATPase/permease subunit